MCHDVALHTRAIWTAFNISKLLSWTNKTVEFAKANWHSFHQMSTLMSQIFHISAHMMEVASAHFLHVFDPLLAGQMQIIPLLDKSFEFITRAITPHHMSMLCTHLMVLIL